MSGFGIQKRGTSPILKQAGSPGPTVPILPEDFTQGPKLPDDIAAKQKPRDTFKKGGRAKDMSEKHEGMESKAEEAKEYAMEDKGYKETKSGKMVKGKAKMAKGGRPGLWANINARKKAGTSRSKSESTISSKAYANMKAGFPKKGKK